MKWRDWLAKWGMTSLDISTPFLEMEWQPGDDDRKAAWDLYIELLTRIATQPLPEDDGDEASALDSVHQLFGLTRDALRRHGPGCLEFAKIAVLMLNQVLRPFTAHWHREALAGGFHDSARRARFRRDLAQVQERLRTYTRMLAEMAGVEDLTQLEAGDSPG